MPQPEARKNKFLSRAMLIPLALVGLALGLWLGAATFVTYHLLHPPFLGSDLGDTIIASEEARASAQLGIDPKSCCNAPFENLRISDDTGTSVDAWFVPGTLPSAVLLIPAMGASKRATLPYLKFLHAAGLPVLMIDSPDFGRGPARWGWGERQIVRDAAAWLRKKGYRNIGALGVSEGAAAALMVQAEAPDTFKIIVADSSFASLGAMLRRYPTLAALNPAFLQTVMGELHLALGHSPDDISPKSAASKIENCALLVIQNEKDPLVTISDGREIFAARANPSSAIYLAPSEGHGDAIYVDAETYQKNVLDFLAQNLPGAAAIARR